MSKKIVLGIFILLVISCNPTTKTAVEKPEFKLLKKDITGLEFENVITQSVDFHLFKYMYFFNGGGVSAGDFNNDGLVDLYFTSNMGSNKLFLNKGSFKFEDATEKAKVSGLSGWTSGVTTVDINNDGLLDIYVSQIGNFEKIKSKKSIADVEDYDKIQERNQLYVCQGIQNGIPVYKDEAAKYNLDLIGFSTQAAFFDYDMDGDLDMYQLNHSIHANGTFGQRKDFEGTKHPFSGDKLMRNDDGKFIDVSVAAGIKSTVIGYGLGVATSDINQDGWTDIYIGNDFHENDYLYINQKDGTFKEVLTEQLLHTSRFTMGVDIADFNNDGLNDIFTLDMLPYEPFILKSSLGEDDYSAFQFKLGYGYNHQFARNNLQLNNGDGTFQEIGMFAGVHATDWSWASLFMDFDNDGHKDLFIANGIPRRMNDIDYANFVTSNPDQMWKKNHIATEENLEIAKKLPQIKIPNKFLKNTRDFKFKDLEFAIEGNEPSYSTGAAYADLDNDGDLDVITNNIESEPFVYQNLAKESAAPTAEALTFKLKGTAQNINAIGAKVIVFKGKERLIYENFPTRGFQSSVPAGLQIGVGNTKDMDKVIVIWNDNTYQEVTNVDASKPMQLTWQAGLPVFDYASLKINSTAIADFEDITSKIGLSHLHKENPFVEFNRERLIPHMTSAEGPALAVGDVNGDGLEDFFVGSSKRENSALYIQTADGKFMDKTPTSMTEDNVSEDVDAKMVDIDKDKDLDLVVATGGNEYRGTEKALMQQLYINDGKGNFIKKTFPNIYMTASCVLPADIDGDGDIDLFFGGRAVPWNYGITPSSYLLKNDGKGNFQPVQEESLEKVGLVKDGNWSDIDGDGDMDLVLAMEWDAITIFINNKGKFKKQTINSDKGWWNFAVPYDFDGDGDVDILGGNLGQNAKLKPTEKEPLRLYVNDFDDNDQIEQVFTYYLGGREIPFANHKELTSQLPSLKKKYIYAKDFASASIQELFGAKKLKASLKLTANTMQSVYYENTGNMIFKATNLPSQLQWSTLESAYMDDFDGNGTKEVMLGSNFYDCNIEMGRYDSHYGNILSFDKGSKMKVSPIGNLKIKGQVRRIASIKIGNTRAYILAKNNDYLQVLKVK
jgi:enediyne biosynthesis protein E4